MNKLKDMFYNKSDILAALLIVCIAGLVILSRIDAIMAYPETLVANAYENMQDQTDPGSGSNDDATVGTSEGAISGGAVTDSGEVEMVSVYINYGESLQVIGDKFVTVKLFDSTEQFIQLVNDMGAATKIKTGNFILPATSTHEEVINAIMKPGLM